MCMYECTYICMYVSWYVPKVIAFKSLFEICNLKTNKSVFIFLLFIPWNYKSITLVEKLKGLVK